MHVNAKISAFKKMNDAILGSPQVSAFVQQLDKKQSVEKLMTKVNEIMLLSEMNMNGGSIPK